MHTFTCSQCGEEYPMGRPDEEARAEAAAQFPAVPADQMAVVCDDCYLLICRTMGIPTNTPDKPIGLRFSHIAYDQFGMISGWLIDGKHVVHEPCYPPPPRVGPVKRWDLADGG